MPIDDALKDIEAGEKKKEEPAPEEIAVKQPEAMWDYARNIIVPVLIDFFNLKLPGQRRQAVLSTPHLESFLQILGFEILTIEPAETTIMSSERTLSCSFSRIVTAQQKKNLIEQIFGKYALETDILEREDIFTLPEFRKIEEAICYPVEQEKYSRATFNPYIIAMRMAPSNRSLAVLAIQKAFAGNRITLPDREIPAKLPPDTIRFYLSQMTPLAKDYIDAAKEYGIKKILSCMINFEGVCQKYAQVWVAK